MGIPVGGSVGVPESFERVLRADISRRQFVRGSAVVVAGLAGFDLFAAAPAFGDVGSPPKPIPGGFTVPDFGTVPINPAIHVLPPAVGFEMATITDFKGVLGAGEIQGSATGSDSSSYAFDADMRFMGGEYVGSDGRRHFGTFGFV